MLLFFRASTYPDFSSKELNVPNPCPPTPRKNLLRLRHRRLVLEFRPEPADAFGAGARHPAKTSAEELMLFFSFQTEATGFLVELAKFPGGLHPFGKSFGKRGALASGDARAMKAGDGVPTDIALRVE